MSKTYHTLESFQREVVPTLLKGGVPLYVLFDYSAYDEANPPFMDNKPPECIIRYILDCHKPVGIPPDNMLLVPVLYLTERRMSNVEGLATWLKEQVPNTYTVCVCRKNIADSAQALVEKGVAKTLVVVSGQDDAIFPYLVRACFYDLVVPMLRSWKEANS